METMMEILIGIVIFSVPAAIFLSRRSKLPEINNG